MESFIPIEGIRTITLSSTVLSKTFQCSMHQSDESMCNVHIVYSHQFRTLHCAGNAPALMIRLAQQQVVIFKTVIAIVGNILSK